MSRLLILRQVQVTPQLPPQGPPPHLFELREEFSASSSSSSGSIADEYRAAVQESFRNDWALNPNWTTHPMWRDRTAPSSISTGESQAATSERDPTARRCPDGAVVAPGRRYEPGVGDVEAPMLTIDPVDPTTRLTPIGWRLSGTPHWMTPTRQQHLSGALCAAHSANHITSMMMQDNGDDDASTPPGVHRLPGGSRRRW